MITLCWCLIVIAGCSTPQKRAHLLALEAGFTRETQAGTQFNHIVYLNHLVSYSVDELHIYIEGDGSPWRDGRYPSPDPTPRHPLALKLMRADPFPALYLGRPCYFGLSSSLHCSTAYWTSKRYSTEVVESMASVIEYFREKHQVQTIVLIGYSGGGTLATLLARKLPGKLFIVTVAANLDTDLWTEQRSFLPLEGSLNPVDFRAETAHIPQIHLAGLDDKTVPITVTQSYASTLDSNFFRYYPDFDHSCCWLGLWPEIIAERPWTGLAEK